LALDEWNDYVKEKPGKGIEVDQYVLTDKIDRMMGRRKPKG